MKSLLLTAIEENRMRRAILESTSAGFTSQDTKDVETVLEVVAGHFQITVDVLKGPVKLWNIVEARWTAMYLVSHFCGLHDNAIARILQKDHTAVSYALRRTKELMQIDPAFFRRVSEAQKRVDEKLGKEKAA